MSQFKDLCAIGRVSNLPTVVSNVFLGCLLSYFFGNYHNEVRFIEPMLIGCFLYLAGCFFNDFSDLKWDAIHKPDRPLVTGRVKKSTLISLILACLSAAFILASQLQTSVIVVSLLIVLMVLIYTVIHKKTVWGCVPMGLSRCLLLYLGLTANKVSMGNGFFQNWDFVSILSGVYSLIPFAPYTFGLLCYIIVLTISARFEASNSLSRPLRVTLICFMAFFLLYLTKLFFFWDQPFALVLLAIITFLLLPYRTLSSNISKAVASWLAGICLLDLAFFLSFSMEEWKKHQQGQETILIFLFAPLVFLSCYFSAKLLQKYASAT